MSSPRDAIRRAKQAKNGQRVYHVSLRANHASILKSGVDPIFSRGKQRYSWWVDGSRVAWAIAHMADRHDVKISALEVWSAPRSALPRIVKSPYPGVWKTPCRVIVRDALPARAFLTSGEK